VIKRFRGASLKESGAGSRRFGRQTIAPDRVNCRNGLGRRRSFRHDDAILSWARAAKPAFLPIMFGRGRWFLVAACSPLLDEFVLVKHGPAPACGSPDAKPREQERRHGRPLGQGGHGAQFFRQCAAFDEGSTTIS
jgi:hypothetical protein